MTPTSPSRISGANTCPVTPLLQPSLDTSAVNVLDESPIL